jgi:hypothetical protein
LAWSLSYVGDAEAFRWDEHPVMGAPGSDPGDIAFWRTVRRHHDSQIETARELAERAAGRLRGPVEITVQGSLGVQEADPAARDVLHITVHSRPSA